MYKNGFMIKYINFTSWLITLKMYNSGTDFSGKFVDISTRHMNIIRLVGKQRTDLVIN